MATGADDYRWLSTPPYDEWIDNGYCVTAVSGLDASELMDAVAASARATVAGLGELEALSYDRWSTPEAGRILVAGFRDVPLGSLMIEVNGYLGVTESLLRPISTGREVVAHFSNVNAYDRFVWWRDGEAVLDWEPVIAKFHVEPSADIRAQIVECGIDLRRADPSAIEWMLLRPGVFALAERLSGVRITPDLLDGELAVGEVDLRPGHLG